MNYFEPALANFKQAQHNLSKFQSVITKNGIDILSYSQNNGYNLQESVRNNKIFEDEVAGSIGA